MVNFNACGTPLNIMQSSKYFARIFFIMIGTISKGGTVKFVTFIFPPLAKGHPNIQLYTIIHIYTYNIHTCLYTDIHIYIHTYTCIHITYLHICTLYLHVYLFTHVYIPLVLTCKHKYIYTYIDAYPYMY